MWLRVSLWPPVAVHVSHVMPLADRCPWYVSVVLPPNWKKSAVDVRCAPPSASIMLGVDDPDDRRLLLRCSMSPYEHPRDDVW